MTALPKRVADALRSGTLVVVVRDPDENLCRQAVEAAANAVAPPVRWVSSGDMRLIEGLRGLLDPKSTGTLIVPDLLGVHGASKQIARTVREIALQQREGSHPRLVLIELPETEIPPLLQGDVDVVDCPLPTPEELRQELDVFVDEQGLTLPGNGDERYVLASAAAGLARHEALSVFARCWVEDRALDPGRVRRAKADRVARRMGGALTFDAGSSDLPGVGGLELLREWLGERRRAFDSRRAREFGLPEPKGLLLLGVPGCGKSLTAKIIARDWSLPLLRLDAGRLFGSLVGASEAKTRGAIQAAEACAPCVLWIDELEKAFAGQSGPSTDSGTSQRVFATLLGWLQEKTAPVFVVATANRVQALPPELLRKGRFDEVFFVDLPQLEERRRVLDIHVRRRGREFAQVALDRLALAADGYSGAELEQGVVDGLFTAFAAGRELDPEDVAAALERTQPLSVTMREDIDALRRWCDGRARPASKIETTEKLADSGTSQAGRFQLN